MTFHYAKIWMSDLHLGQPVASPNLEKLRPFFEACTTEHLYLLGDIEDTWHMLRFPTLHDNAALAQGLLAIADFIGNKRPETTPGNHDPEGPAWLEMLRLRDRKIVRGSVKGVPWIGVHGHHQEWMWRVGNLLGYLRMIWVVPRQRGRTLKLREYLVARLGTYRRLAKLARRQNAARVIHGHVHCPGVRMVDGVQVICLPDWIDNPGGALVEDLEGNLMLVDAEHNVVLRIPEITR